jgi:hypothetical protein
MYFIDPRDADQQVSSWDEAAEIPVNAELPPEPLDARLPRQVIARAYMVAEIIGYP